MKRTFSLAVLVLSAFVGNALAESITVDSLTLQGPASNTSVVWLGEARAYLGRGEHASVSDNDRRGSVTNLKGDLVTILSGGGALLLALDQDARFMGFNVGSSQQKSPKSASGPANEHRTESSIQSIPEPPNLLLMDTGCFLVA